MVGTRVARTAAERAVPWELAWVVLTVCEWVDEKAILSAHE
jgi:hypothetical protein